MIFGKFYRFGAEVLIFIGLFFGVIDLLSMRQWIANKEYVATVVFAMIALVLIITGIVLIIWAKGANVVFQSKYTKRKYYMYRTKIVVPGENGKTTIHLPQANEALRFYQIMHSKDYIRVIVRMRNADLYAYALDEAKITLIKIS